MAIRFSPLLKTLLLVASISAGIANQSLGQQPSPAKSSRRSASEGTLGSNIVSATAIQPVAREQQSADDSADIEISVADFVQEPLSNEVHGDLDLKPLSQFRFQQVTEDVQPKDYFSNVKANSEMPSVSSHIVSWAPAGMVHRPFYFEEHNLERCGQTAPGIRQPSVSGRKFFLRGILFPLQTLWDRPRSLEGIDSNECNFFDE